MARLVEPSAKQKKGINQTSTSGGPRHWGLASYRSLEWVTVFGLWRILLMWARMREESLGNLSLCNTHGKMTKGLLLSALSARSTSIFPLYSSPNHKWMISFTLRISKGYFLACLRNRRTKRIHPKILEPLLSPSVCCSDFSRSATPRIPLFSCPGFQVFTGWNVAWAIPMSFRREWSYFLKRAFSLSDTFSFLAYKNPMILKNHKNQSCLSLLNLNDH